jgi:hypothetical protein
VRRDVSTQHRECPRRCDRTPGAGHGGTKLHARPQRTRHAPSRRLTSSWPRMATLLDEIKGDRAAPPRAGPVVPQRHHDGVSDDRRDPVAGPCPPAGHLTSFTNAICRPAAGSSHPAFGGQDGAAIHSSHATGPRSDQGRVLRGVHRANSTAMTSPTAQTIALWARTTKASHSASHPHGLSYDPGGSPDRRRSLRSPP